jgi:hypothetical protein
MRTHCSHCDRRIWVYPQPQFEAMKAAMVLRNALVSSFAMQPDLIYVIDTFLRIHHNADE